jgi:hypothetical protein
VRALCYHNKQGIVCEGNRPRGRDRDEPLASLQAVWPAMLAVKPASATAVVDLQSYLGRRASTTSPSSRQPRRLVLVVQSARAQHARQPDFLHTAR